jgi:hypothetical protein
MSMDGDNSGCDLMKWIQLGGDLQITWIMFDHVKHVQFWTTFAVATLALGSRLRQRLVRAWAKRNVWENEDGDSHSQVSSHFGSLESWWTPETLESDGRGQNTSY